MTKLNNKMRGQILDNWLMDKMKSKLDQVENDTKAALIKEIESQFREHYVFYNSLRPTDHEKWEPYLSKNNSVLITQLNNKFNCWLHTSLSNRLDFFNSERCKNSGEWHSYLKITIKPLYVPCNTSLNYMYDKEKLYPIFSEAKKELELLNQKIMSVGCLLASVTTIKKLSELVPDMIKYFPKQQVNTKLVDTDLLKQVKKLIS